MSCGCNAACCVRVVALTKCCACGCERQLSRLSGSRNSVHFVIIDREWSLHDAMLVHAFHSLQKPVPARSILTVLLSGSTTANPPRPLSPERLRESFCNAAQLTSPPLRASCCLDFVLSPGYLVRMVHPARHPGQRSHSRRRAGARCSHVASFGQTAVLPSMHFRPFISFSMHVCFTLGSWLPDVHTAQAIN